MTKTDIFQKFQKFIAFISQVAVMGPNSKVSKIELSGVKILMTKNLKFAVI